jgi:type IV pilus modification protein PilV
MRYLTRERCRGLTLVEVLIALVVLALGLLGVGALVGVAIRQNHLAGLHSHAVFVAESIRDRMSSNVAAVWAGAYDGAIAAAAPAAATADCGTGCTPVALAALDRIDVGSELFHLLGPTASGNITCARLGAMPPNLADEPPYTGTCDVTLAWTELDLAGVREVQSLRWRFIP